jgi:hypothetical protein
MIVSKHAVLGSIAGVSAFPKALPREHQLDGNGPGLQGR